jgi:hypothetical protein
MIRRLVPIALLVLIAGAVGGADLRTLKNETFKGDIVGATDKEIVFSTGGEKVTLPITQIHSININPEGKIEPGTKYADLELTDGSLLHCKEVTLGPKGADVVFLDDRKTHIPIAAVSSILYEGHVPASRKDWSERIAKKRTRDAVVIRFEDVINALPGTIGDPTPDGKELNFLRLIDKGMGKTETRKETVAISRLHGLIYNRNLPPTAPPVAAKLYDTARNLIMVSGQSFGEDGLTVTTPAGVKFVYPLAQISRLDYSSGNLVYLSDLDPINVRMTSTFELVYPYRRDRNLDGKDKLRIGPDTFEKGLAMHSYTELEYDLRGDYRAFSCVAGFDAAVGGHPGPVVLTIEGDGRELKKMVFDRKDKAKAETISLNIKDVQKLRIIVSSGDLLDMGKHLDLGDAKVTKGDQK